MSVEYEIYNVMYIKVRVFPKSKKEEVVEMDSTHFEIKVKEPAERNLANARVREIVAERLKVPMGKVRIISGHRSLSKILSVDI